MPLQKNISLHLGFLKVRKIGELFLLIALGLFCSAPATAQTPFNAVEGSFSLNVPNGWIRVSRQEMLVELSDIRQENFLNDGHGRPPEYLFRDRGDRYRIAVTVRRTPGGRSPKWILEDLSKSSAFIEELRSSEKSASPYIHNINISNPVFDNKTGYLWVHMDVQMIIRGSEINISQLHVLVPTEDGFIALKGFTSKDHYSRLIPIFHSVVSSISIQNM